MARYVSRSPKYTLGIGEGEMAQANGIYFETKAKKVAKFQQGVALDHELEAALKAFTFRGLPDGVPPETYISVFDTSDYQTQNKLTDEEREEIEAWIESRAQFGVDYIKVDELRSPKPWPNYDEDSIEDVLGMIEKGGFDPDTVRRYEQENANRVELLEKLVELGAADVERTDLEELRPLESETIETRQRDGSTKSVVVKA